MGLKIDELPSTSGIKKEDVLIVEDTEGTKKGTVQQLDEALGVGQLKKDLDNVIDKQENLWTIGDVVSSYKANTQYQSKYYDIPLDDGEYYIQYDNVVGAVAGDIQIFPYGKSEDIITNITPPNKSGNFSPKNGGIRIYFFSTLTNTSENDGVSTWSGIKLVKGTNIVNPSIKESALPDFYKTLPTVIPKIEEDAKKSALFDDIATVKKTPNLFTHGDVSLTFETGTMWRKVDFDIPLTEGKTYTFRYNNVENPIENAGVVQIFPYEKDTDIVVSDIYPQEEKTFVSPPNGVRIDFWGVMQTSPQESGTTIWSGIELQEGEEIKPEKETTIKESALPKFVQNIKIAESFEIVSNTFSSGESLALKVSNSKSRNHIGFDATINNMGKITIYYGKDMAFNDCKLTIDSTEVISYNCTQTWVEMAKGNHGLVLAHHISVRIDTSNDKKAVISITDETGKTYELQTEWVCGHGDVVVENENGSYTKCKLTFYPSEYRQKVWAYGDSYFDLWPWICNAKGASHWMIDGFSGRGSADALKSLKIALKHATPSIVLWCLGMNDPDTETEISASWLENIQKVKAICDENNITLIPATIPNVPTRNHSFKNTYVRENFSRYVDISEALGAETSTSWYSGLLPDGDIHPSDAGRVLIAQKVMCEVPEIF